MATFHSGSEGQTQKLQALRRRQKRLAFRAVIVPPVCWGICAASAPWWFPPLKETLAAALVLPLWKVQPVRAAQKRVRARQRERGFRMGGSS